MKTLRVLIVEDYRDIADMVALWVKSAGHDARVCYTGFQALQAAPAYRPDVVLMDIGLPDIDGWELASLLRESASKIIAISAYQSLKDRRKSKEAGIDLHLGKPVSMNMVLSLLAQLASDQNKSSP
ncbi:MAG TPA: response regulator [Pirellulales bacterium]|nr:response regulator [Pirellulales bacterium]